ncbi:MAG: iron export ABC transporter permease subunit FetB [Bacteriovoracaceae bacterium]
MGVFHILTAFSLVLICTFISWKQDHHLEKDFLIGALRNILQLLLLGFILNWIFKNSSLSLSLVIAFIMTFNSAIHSSQRIKSKYPKIMLNNFVATSLAIWPIAFLSTQILGEGVWWRPETFLPILGMLLGSTLNGMSLGIEHFCHEVREKKEDVLTLLALGATAQESTKELMKRSLKIAMTPNLNAMLSMGLVSIPGMMTGQILGGSDPTEAAIYQIVMMLLIVASCYLSSYLGLLFSQRKLFNSLGQPCF